MTDECIVYSHTQQASLAKHLPLVLALTLVLLLTLAVGAAATGRASWLLAATAVFGGALSLGPAWALSRQFLTLHIEIGEGVLTWKFTGMSALSIQVADITDVRVVTPSWGAGIGMHTIRGGMLYNVALGGAVEVTACGRRTQLGTDEPEALAAALRSTTHVPGSDAVHAAGR